MSSDSSYSKIAQRKQSQLDAQIPAEWKLPASAIPEGMLSIADSITNVKEYQSVNVMGVPRNCGLLTHQELAITENYDIRALLTIIAEGRLTSEEVIRAFSKVSSSSMPVI